VTIHSRVAAARAELRAAHIEPDEADRDARLLAEFVLQWDSARYLTSAQEPAPPEFEALYQHLVRRRARREPLAYITGQQEFWGLPFEVSPAVLIPRPETELIVETALALFPDPLAQLSAADACTGSGCVAIALARERPRATLVATDVSGASLLVARRNAARHDVATRVRLVQADLLAGVEGPFDLITANPPYVPSEDAESLQPEVRNHEPRLALFAGPDGFAVMRRLVEESMPRLRPGGTLLFEIGWGQADAVRELISSSPGLTMIALRSDLRGIPRMAHVQRQ